MTLILTDYSKTLHCNVELVLLSFHAHIIIYTYPKMGIGIHLLLRILKLLVIFADHYLWQSSETTAQLDCCVPAGLRGTVRQPLQDSSMRDYGLPGQAFSPCCVWISIIQVCSRILPDFHQSKWGWRKAQPEVMSQKPGSLPLLWVCYQKSKHLTHSPPAHAANLHQNIPWGPSIKTSKDSTVKIYLQGKCKDR